jgi:hypothetical protein
MVKGDFQTKVVDHTLINKKGDKEVFSCRVKTIDVSLSRKRYQMSSTVDDVCCWLVSGHEVILAGCF